MTNNKLKEIASGAFAKKTTASRKYLGLLKDETHILLVLVYATIYTIY